VSAPEESREPQTEQVRVRRSPKILNFLLTGAVLGAVVALILTFAFPNNSQYPASQVLGFLLVLGVVVGAALGAVAALLFERSSQRRAREVEAVREVTLAPPAPEAPPEPEPEADPEPEPELRAERPEPRDGSPEGEAPPRA
jgi:uncharacterized membrane protein